MGDNMTQRQGKLMGMLSRVKASLGSLERQKRIIGGGGTSGGGHLKRGKNGVYFVVGVASFFVLAFFGLWENYQVNIALPKEISSHQYIVRNSPEARSPERWPRDGATTTTAAAAAASESNTVTSTRTAPVTLASTTTATATNSGAIRLKGLQPAYSGPRREKTETGIDISDPALFDGVDLKGDSSTATVIGMATGYGLDVYERFVGTLRRAGYRGHIILGISPSAPNNVLEYFRYRNVTAKKLRYVNCTYQNQDKVFQKPETCADPYPDIKTRWSRFPLAYDWLQECATCTGPILIMDVRDSFFQLDPFGPGSPVVRGLQVFQEHMNQTTLHWITNTPIGACKGITFNEPMLCSGTTVGTRAAMLKYLEVMYAEMRQWISSRRCHFNMDGDDQSIHNYLFYTGQLPFATAIPNRSGGIVNTVGKEAALIAKQHSKTMQERHGIEHGQAMWKPFDGATYEGGKERWIGEQFNMIDDDGYFTEFDGSRSRVIHQYDRFGRPYINLWMNRRGKDRFRDPMPIN